MTLFDWTGHRVDTIIASAGTGKTTTLVDRVTNDLVGGLAPQQLLVTTFTKRAAAELRGRIREKLIRQGRADLAAAMLAARIGTVNSVCGGLIEEFAFTLGRSPVAEINPDEQQKAVFARSIGEVLAHNSDVIRPLAANMGIEAQSRTIGGVEKKGWQDYVRLIVDRARSNGIAPNDLAPSARHSVDTLLALLPSRADGVGAEALDEALRVAVEQCWQDQSPGRAGLKKGSQDDLGAIEELLPALSRREPIAWSAWAKLSKLGKVKGEAHLFADVMAAAAAHSAHPRLRDDIAGFITAIFACAAACMDAYSAYKLERGLVDFIDQEMLALDILRNPANHDALCERIGAVFVDEYQDSSPVQIAIFTALAQISPKNLWVGDPKQSIYGFRGADPNLTQAAAKELCATTAGELHFLQTSWRSRPDIGAFVNAAFEPNFLALGMTREEICFDRFARPATEAGASALSVWAMGGKNKGERAALLAARVAGLLVRGDAWPIQDKGHAATRAARGGDIALLCRNNSQVLELASAMIAKGLKVTVGRDGLLDQPEVELLTAALRWVSDPSDTLAGAEIMRLTAADASWLEASFTPDKREAFAAEMPFADSLNTLRKSAPKLTPAEMLDAIVHIPGLQSAVLRWGMAEDRSANIEALRGLLVRYQDERRSERQAATLAGACTWLARLDKAKQPQSRHPDSLHILNYHQAKGLEWPICVLTDLDDKVKGSPFDLHVETDGQTDPADPLAGRRLRFWPRPYGAQSKDIALYDAADNSQQGNDAAVAERHERTRLLYVGMTRARDHLCLALAAGTDWLDELRTAQDAPLVTLSPDACAVGGASIPLSAQPDPLFEPPRTISLDYAPPHQESVVHLPFHVRPSAAFAIGAVRIGHQHRLGDRLALIGNPDITALGEATHRFLACDDHRAEAQWRSETAKGLLDRWAVTQFKPADLVTASNRLANFLQTQFPAARPRREWPVYALRGEQVVTGWIDLLLEDDEGFVIIDHKSFPGSLEVDEDRLRSFAGQVTLYGQALDALFGRPCREYWVHQPIAGLISRVDIGNAS